MIKNRGTIPSGRWLVVEHNEDHNQFYACELAMPAKAPNGEFFPLDFVLVEGSYVIEGFPCMEFRQAFTPCDLQDKRWIKSSWDAYDSGKIV